jgi:hypothetical protein
MADTTDIEFIEINGNAPVQSVTHSDSGSSEPLGTGAKADQPVITDLSDILCIPTQKRAEVTDEVINEDAPPKDVPGVAEFDTAKVDAIKETTATIADATVTTSFDTDKLADTIIDLADTIITNAGPYLYEYCLHPTERQGLKDLAKAYRLAKANSEKFKVTPDQETYLEIQTELEQYEELLPFSESEKNSLHVPLKALLKEVSYQSSPKNALVMAATIITIPRILPLVPKLVKKYKNKA